MDSQNESKALQNRLNSAASLSSPQESIDLGEIMYSLCYLPTAGRMTVTVIKCRNLKAMDITGSSGKLNDSRASHKFDLAENDTAGGLLEQKCERRPARVML